MAVATLPNFLYPGDISESARHYHEDIIEPPITLQPGGKLKLSEEPGIGVTVSAAQMSKLTQQTFEFRS
jgi:O-succinylbenzoate synthase